LDAAFLFGNDEEGDVNECKRHLYLDAILHYNLFINYNFYDCKMKKASESARLI